MTGMRLGVDVGGTFTDLVFLTPDGTVVARKVLSTPPVFNEAIRQGIEQAMAEADCRPADVREYVHGTTAATNAIITRSGGPTGLITTRGFRDVLEIARMRSNKLYDITSEKPLPLVPRPLRLEAPARMTPWGDEDEPLDEAAANTAVVRLLAAGVRSVAVCYVHAYANGAHEVRTRQMVLEQNPRVYVSISSEVLPEIKEYERTSTTVINAYVQPVVDQYFWAMEKDLQELGMHVPLMVMKSDGGMMPANLARRLPCRIIESGPAAGVTGVFHVARRIGIANAMSLDMGGTTAKAALIEEGKISFSPEYEVGGEASAGNRLMKGSGYLLGVPTMDLAEVGSGGGSIAWVDQGGALKVGPHSAGAVPGPACYGRGGVQPTVTDANVLLGLTSPVALAGGALPIHPELAEKAIRDHLGTSLGLAPTDIAWGIRQITNASLIRALRAVSMERGRFPENFVLFAFGGMGPVHALSVAEELRIPKVVIPVLPGLFSSLGLLFAEVEHHLVQTHYCSAIHPDFERLDRAIADIVAEPVRLLHQQGYDAPYQSITLHADVRYAGQDAALTIPLRGTRLDPDALSRLVDDFHREHEQTYGYRSGQGDVQIVALRCVARGRSDESRVPERLRASGGSGPRPAARRCYFGPERGWIDAPILGRGDLAGSPAQGPLLIEEDSSLTVVLPGWTAVCDEWSNIILTRAH